jgi:nucleoside-diphosphate-sugar epimerase
VRETLILLKNELDVDADIVFNGTARAGDPLFYHADISNALALGWKPARPFLEGLGNYVVWLTNNKELLND